MLLSKIFQSEGGELVGDGGRLHTVEFFDLYCSQNIIQMIKLRTARWAGHVMWEEEERFMLGFGGET